MASQCLAEGSAEPQQQDLEFGDVATPFAAATTTGTSTSQEKENPNKGKIRISKLGTHYLVYDVKDMSLLRRLYRMGGTFFGMLPQAPNQNTLGGLPLELSADNVSWLVQDLKVAYIANDWEAHRNVLYGEGSSKEQSDYRDFVNGGRREAQARFDADQAQRMADSARLKAANAAKASKVKAERQKRRAASKAVSKEAEGDDSQPRESWVVLADPNKKESTDTSTIASTDVGSESESVWPTKEEQSDFEERKEEELNSTSTSTAQKEPWLYITPTASTGLVGGTNGTNTGVDADAAVPYPARPSQAEVSADALRADLANHGFYTTPGLRFGGDMSVYPGDPLRYHAHYVATSYGWDEPITMLDLVGTGRLATGVKKGLLIGGAKPDGGEDNEEARPADGSTAAAGDTSDAVQSASDNSNTNGCRSFTIEWAAI